jgi:hypothetical protein
VVVGLRVDFSCRFWETSLCRGGSAENCTYSIVFLLLQSRSYRRGFGGPKGPASFTAPRYNPSICIMVLGCVTELGVSRPKVIRCRWYADQCIFATVSLSNCPRFLDSPRMRRWVSFHVPPPRNIWSFGSTSPLFIGCTLSPPGRVSGEQRGGAAEISSRTGAEHGS